MNRSNPQSKSNLRVLALEPYFGLSHKTFLEGYRKHSRHSVEIWALKPWKWKWRMRGSAIHFADAAAARPASDAPHVVLASDFLNLADWRALAPRGFRDAPAILYFHENQITYPLGAGAPREAHYGWIHLSSALAAERILFNSSYHREAFLHAVEEVLALMPDHVPPDIPDKIRRRSGVFPVGIDFEPHRAVLAAKPRVPHEKPVLVWNHRWEDEKGPDIFLEGLLALKAKGIPFRAIVCGQAFKKVPQALRRLESELAGEILHFGFFESREDYLAALAEADVVVSTARQEFFGVSVVEAMYMGCLPVLPRALSYPEILPPGSRDLFLYDFPATFPDFLARFLSDLPVTRREDIQQAACRFDWKLLAPELDDRVEEAHHEGRP